MAWGKVDDNLAFHPKVAMAGNEAMGLWVRAMSYSCQQLTDGFIPAVIVQSMQGDKAAAKLVDVGLWIKVENGYQFKDWNEYQPSAVATKERKAEIAEKRSMAGKKGMEARYANKSDNKPLTNDVTNEQQTSNPEPEPEPNIKDLFNDVERAPYSDDFEAFWKSYPRRQAKGDAWKAWSQLRKQKLLPALDVLTVAAESYGRRSTEPKYVKLPGGWLREHRWLDEDEAPARPFNPYDPVKGEKPAWKAVVEDPWLA